MSDKPKDDDWGMTMPHVRLDKDNKADGFSDEFAPDPYSARQPSAADDWGMTQQNFSVPQNQSVPPGFDKTTPNINVPSDVRRDSDQPSSSSSPPSSPDDWGMTQQNFSVPNRQKADDGWGATTPNINLPRENKTDDWEMSAPQPSGIPPVNKTDDWGMSAPNQNIQPETKPDDWGMTQPNVNIPNASVPRTEDRQDNWSMPAPVFRISEGEKVDNLPKRTPNFDKEPIGFDKTAPNFNFAENSPPGIYGASPAANPAMPPPPNVAAPAVQENPAAKSGGSKLIYALAGLIVMLFFGIVALAGVYFLYLDKPGATSIAETPKEEPRDTAAPSAPTSAPAAAPMVAPTAETAMPKEIEYKGAMVLVAAGEFTMGSDADADESKPAHAVALPAFYIDKTEVTNAEYKKFCDAIGKSYPPDPHLEKDYFKSRPNAPVVGVSFADAKAYAEWAGKRLPTEAEWEKAASWDEAAKTKRAFPWGNDFQKGNVAFGIASISDVGKFSGGASPSGAFDMAGNVLEWVDAYFQPYAGNTAANPEFGEKNRVVRGGHFGSKTNDSLKTTKRIYVSPDIASGEDDEKLIAAIIGFRCAVSADDAELKEVLNAQSK